MARRQWVHFADKTTDFLSHTNALLSQMNTWKNFIHMPKGVHQGVAQPPSMVSRLQSQQSYNPLSHGAAYEPTGPSLSTAPVTLTAWVLVPWGGTPCASKILNTQNSVFAMLPQLATNLFHKKGHSSTPVSVLVTHTRKEKKKISFRNPHWFRYFMK